MTTPASFSSWASLLRSRRMNYFLRIAALCLLLLFAAYELFQNLFAVHAQYPPVQSTIFLDTGAPTFPLTTNGASGSIAYSVANASGTTVARGRVTATGRQTNLTLPRLPDDYYTLQITDQTGAQPISRSLPFVMLAPFAAPADSPLGVGVHFTGGNNPNLASLSTTVGAAAGRDDASWAMME